MASREFRVESSEILVGNGTNVGASVQTLETGDVRIVEPGAKIVSCILYIHSSGPLCSTVE